MAVGPYSQDVLTRIYNVHWGGEYANRVIVVTDTHPANVHVTKNGWQWDNIGDLGYAGTGWGEFHDPSSITFGGYRRDINKFAVSGFKQNFAGGTADPAVNFDMVSADGYHWSALGADMDPELNFSYSEDTGSSRMVNGFVYRVAGSAIADNSTRWGHVDGKRYLDPKYARYGGSLIQGCDDASAKEDDNNPPDHPWQTVLAAGERYSSFGPIEVIKGDGEDDVPTLVCLVTLADDDRKFGVLASSDGISFTLTFQGQIIQFGGAASVGFAAARAT
jgi:hypothetical protein